MIYPIIIEKLHLPLKENSLYSLFEGYFKNNLQTYLGEESSGAMGCLCIHLSVHVPSSQDYRPVKGYSCTWDVRSEDL